MPFHDQGKRLTYTCAQCSAEFRARPTSRYQPKYCSSACSGRAKRVLRYERPCANCGKPLLFTADQIARGRKYCGPACVAKGNIGRGVTRVRCACKRCGKEYEVNRARALSGGGKFCSSKCAAQRDPSEKPPRKGIVLDRSKPGIVYQRTNLINGKHYIGATAATATERAAQDVRQALNGGGRLIERAVRKYGADMFRLTVLKRCPDMVEAFAEEARLIALLKPEYNLTKGGEGNIGYRYTEEQLAVRRGRQSPLKGRKRPIEVVERIAARLRGRKLNLSESALEIRRQQALAMRERPRRPWTAQRHSRHREVTAEACSRPVRCINDGKAFASATAADAHYGLHRGAVSGVATGAKKSTHGLRFVFLEERKNGGK